MLEKLLSGAVGDGADFATVAVRMPKTMHVKLKDLCEKHGLSLQQVGLEMFKGALAELDAHPVKTDASDTPPTTPDASKADKSKADKGKK